ncbi:TPA: hypothetical protein I9088_001474 [Clostridium perfringens]|nr:hypothetical protein [Clostridium perfringens]
MDKEYNECLSKVDNILKRKSISSEDLLKVIDDYINLKKENLYNYNIKNLKYKEQIIELKILFKVMDEEAFKYSNKIKYNGLYGIYKAEVKTRLIMMFIKTINEIICMIENGFCSCALSRIRYVYEISVFMNIMESNDEKLAKNFWDYSEKSRLKLARYIKDIDTIKDICTRFKQKNIIIHGDYNWAKDIFKNNKSVKKQIYFSDLAKMTKLKNLYGIYVQSCLYSHADIFGSITSIDKYEFEDRDIWITTPSEQGTEIIYKYLKILIPIISLDYFASSKKCVFIITMISRIFNLNLFDKLKMLDETRDIEDVTYK